MATPAIDRLDTLLSDAFGGRVRIVGAEPIPPWSVMRCALDGGGDAPSSVIVKWLREDPKGFRVDPRQVASERAALEFLKAIGFSAAPRVIAADLQAAVLVLEDVGGTPLADLIRRDGPDAHAEDLLSFARAAGALGAATAGLEADYATIRARYGVPDRAVGRARGLGPAWPATRVRLAALGLPLDGEASAELAEVEHAILAPGAFLALTSGDAHPNNVLCGAGGSRLIDFEAADYRHALVSAVWIHVPGPAWITVDHPRNAALEEAFRSALAAGIAEAEDNVLFGGGMAAVCLAEACDRLARFPVLDARAPGDASRVQMVATLEAGARAARRHRAMPELAGWCERAAAWLRRRWPDADLDLAAYSAYAPRA
ncbi:MAG TPA: hypothetical protein VN806_09310 [Caulobacteraceae bacterium]|nr:hypothetical protein [Caulobacteraceae bacterium]